MADRTWTCRSRPWRSRASRGTRFQPWGEEDGIDDGDDDDDRQQWARHLLELWGARWWFWHFSPLLLAGLDHGQVGGREDQGGSLANITMITLFKIIIMIIPTIKPITITATLINISTKVVVVDSSLANQSLSLNSGEVLKVQFTKIMFSLTLILTSIISNSSFRTMFPGSECSPCVKF